MSQTSQSRGMGMVVIFCAAAGIVTVVATVASGHGNFEPRADADRAPSNATEDYGRRLLTETTEYLGPDVADPAMRFTQSRLACASCHLKAGAEPGNLSLAAAMSRYPRISPRSGANETIEARINGCMIRSMNGRALPERGAEMIAMVSWLRFLAAENAAKGAGERQAHDPPEFKTPNRAADLAAGERVFGKRCAACHGQDGAGLPASGNPIHGYVFPALWGPYSFNDGAGLHRVLTAAKFIKAKMPLGRADLTDDEAFDAAAFVNSKPRPEMANLDLDFPNRAKKPVDTSYGPYADPFPREQHRFGPFAPIEAYYRGLQKVSARKSAR